MVFLSTLQVLLWRHSRPRSVFVFGYRQLTQRIVVDEIIMGIFLVFPISLVVAHLTMRLAVAGWRPKFVRSDLWTTLLITTAGDLFLEILLPSLQCLPMHNNDHNDIMLSDDAYYYTDGSPAARFTFEDAIMSNSNNNTAGFSSFFLWLSQTWGFACPATNSSTLVDRNNNSPQLLSPDAVGTLLTLRLLFMCIGVYLGESFMPIALTGGIACGKSTVAQLLVDRSITTASADPSLTTTTTTTITTTTATTTTTSTTHHNKSTKRRKSKKSSPAPTPPPPPRHKGFFFGEQQQQAQAQASEKEEEEEEGSFLLIDTDAIAHEILLPPAVLAAASDQNYQVHPNDSVYLDILDAFGDASIDHTNILQTGDGDNDDNDKPTNMMMNTMLIDRRKLGALIFADPAQRRLLNQITHPRIVWIMLKRILWGIFWSHQHDVVCVDVPLLLEQGQMRRLFGLVIVVVCNPTLQLQRLQARNPDLTEQQCQERIASQMPLHEKMRMADILIVNDYENDMESLQRQVERVRRDVMGRLYGIGMSLLQMLLLVGGSLSLAVSSRLFAYWT